MNYVSLFVDLSFPLKGKLLPLDNGYIIYSALSRICPNLHKLTNILIHPIAGIPNSSKKLRLTKRSKLQIRIEIEQIPLVYEFLAGQTFKIGQDQFHIGLPEYKELTSCSILYSRLVIIRRCIEPQVFLELYFTHKSPKQYGNEDVAVSK